MVAGWYITDSNNNVYKSWHAAGEAFRGNPLLRFCEVTISMEGTQMRDVSREVADRVER